MNHFGMEKLIVWTPWIEFLNALLWFSSYVLWKWEKLTVSVMTRFYTYHSVSSQISQFVFEGFAYLIFRSIKNKYIALFQTFCGPEKADFNIFILG